MLCSAQWNSGCAAEGPCQDPMRMMEAFDEKPELDRVSTVSKAKQHGTRNGSSQRRHWEEENHTAPKGILVRACVRPEVNGAMVNQ